MPRVYQCEARAKLNLGLRILGRREDGFHELRTVFQTVALADRVRIEIVPGRGIDLTIVAAPGCAAPADAGNLAWRAAEMAAAAFGVRGRLRLRLRKRIPVGAGLGGGSSDAAAVLRLLAGAARRRPSVARCFELAAALGSDVAPLLLGGTALGLGRGDEVYPLPDLPRWHVVLALPRDGGAQAISTPEAFRRWDAAEARPATLTPGARSATMTEFYGWLSQPLPASRPWRDRGALRAPKVQAGLENDFERVVFPLSADFPRIQELLRRQGAVAVGLSGSGAAQYGLFRTAAAAERGAARLEATARTWQTRFVPRERHWGVVQW